jgi:precorrin-2 dehydrogenase/sirohydrochlorin ferrochelatase
MASFPVALDLTGRGALVVGGGGEAPRAIERLLAAGARVTVVAPGDVDASILQAEAAGLLALHRRPFDDGDLAGQAIVFLTPGDDDLSLRLHRELTAAGRLVCTLDRPEVSTFANLAVVTVSGLTLAFGSDGASPGTLRRIREDLAELFADPRFPRYLEALRRLRERLPRGEERSARMRAALEGFAIEAKLRFPAWLERGEDP